MTLKAVFEQLAEAQDMPKKQALAMATGMVDMVTSILKAGDRVRLSGLGILEVKDRPARMGRNPATGAAVQIAASPTFATRPRFWKFCDCEMPIRPGIVRAQPAGIG